MKAWYHSKDEEAGVVCLSYWIEEIVTRITLQKKQYWDRFLFGLSLFSFSFLSMVDGLQRQAQMVPCRPEHTYGFSYQDIESTYSSLDLR